MSSKPFLRQSFAPFAFALLSCSSVSAECGGGADRREHVINETFAMPGTREAGNPKHIVSPLKAVWQPLPEYPAEARAAKCGVVTSVVRYRIGTNGRLIECQLVAITGVAQVSPESQWFLEETCGRMRDWHFEPMRAIDESTDPDTVRAFESTRLLVTTFVPDR